jgi:hypothetical protein
MEECRVAPSFRQQIQAPSFGLISVKTKSPNIGAPPRAKMAGMARQCWSFIIKIHAKAECFNSEPNRFGGGYPL